jgi:site-specific DNA recombinase
VLTATYTDHAISGASTLRPGYQKLMEDARVGSFDVVIAEALDRLSRDQEDMAALFKRLRFAGVRIVTLAEGEISELHVGLKGTMNALFLKDMAEKTRRGLEGRVRAGRSGGGLCYGYEVVRQLAANGEADTGLRQINEPEATIVLRIFAAFAAGESPRAIAMRLNREGIPGPMGRTWGPSTIYGNWRRGTGILNNELYAAQLVWNRQRYVKDPSTGRRVARLNTASEQVLQQVPQLRIVDEALWNAVKARQVSLRSTVITSRDGTRSERARRPVYLLSNLIRCGSCGGGFSMISATLYGCSNARNRGTCANRLNIRRDVLEASVLSGLRTHLLHPDLVKAFVAEFCAETNRLAAEREQAGARERDELARVEREIANLITAIKAGIITPSTKAELEALELRKAELIANVAAAPAPPPAMPRFHPGLAEVYARKVENLVAELNREETRAEAAEVLRQLIAEVRLVPENGKLEIEIRGELAALLQLGQRKSPRLGRPGAQAQVTLVAGAGFEPATFRL